MNGIPAPEGYKGPYWGAMATYTPPSYEKIIKSTMGILPRIKYVKKDCFVDYPDDRKTSVGMTEDFSEFLNLKALPAMVKWCNDYWIGSDESSFFEFRSSSTNGDLIYHLKASPNRSYGYLYIGAWVEKLTERPSMTKEQFNECEKRDREEKELFKRSWESTVKEMKKKDDYLVPGGFFVNLLLSIGIALGAGVILALFLGSGLLGWIAAGVIVGFYFLWKYVSKRFEEKG